MCLDNSLMKLMIVSKMTLHKNILYESQMEKQITQTGSTGDL